MTVFLYPEVVSALPLTSLDPYIVALTGSGLVVGSVSVASDDLIGGQQSMAVWGDDTFTPEIDGALTNEPIYFRLVNGNELYNIDLFVSYQTNTIEYISWVPNSELLCFRLEGCTDATALNYNPNATDDDGSCIVAKVVQMRAM